MATPVWAQLHQITLQKAIWEHTLLINLNVRLSQAMSMIGTYYLMMMFDLSSLADPTAPPVTVLTAMAWRPRAAA
eukprot:9172887-Karenia_brevis.AAC.1